jgi:hypothetical protein
MRPDPRTQLSVWKLNQFEHRLAVARHRQLLTSGHARRYRRKIVGQSGLYLRANLSLEELNEILDQTGPSDRTNVELVHEATSSVAMI